MSHELRTPLNAIIGFSQLLGFEELTNKQLASIDEIYRAGKYLLELINDILDLARIEAGHTNLKIEPVHLSRILGECNTVICETSGVTLWI